MPQEINKAITFKAYFTYVVDGQSFGKTGLADVTVDVYGPDGALLVDGEAATEVGDSGCYEYELGAADVTVYGDYFAKFATGDTSVEVAEIPDLRECAPWVTRVIQTLTLAESPSGTGIDDSLAGLRQMLRKRLNDLDGGKYTTGELDYCINVGYRETQIATRCHKEERTYNTTGAVKQIATTPAVGGADYSVGDVLTLASPCSGVTAKVCAVSAGGVVTGVKLLTAGSAATVAAHDTTVVPDVGTDCTVSVRSLEPVFAASTHTYNISPIFEIIEITVDDEPLSKFEVGDKKKKSDERNWNADTEDTPTEWMQVTGASVRVHPTPNSAAATNTLRVHGYATASDLQADDDYPTAIPGSYAVSAILDRAEAEARKMRSTAAENAVLAPRLLDSWLMWCKIMTASLRGERWAW
jgi:hypothetical protein